MKTLYKFILKTYAGPVFMAIALVTFIFIMQMLWLQADDIAGKGLSASTILKFLGWASLTVLELSIIMGALFSSLIVMGNMGQNNELLALKASGISLHRLFYPLYISIVLLAVTSFCISSYVTPYAYYKMRTMLTDIRNTKEEISIPAGIFYNEIESRSILVKNKDPKTGALSGVMIYDHSNKEGNLSLTLADSGYIMQNEEGNMLIRLINGKAYEEDKPQSSVARNRGEEDKKGFTIRNFVQQSAVVNISESHGTAPDFLKEAPNAQSIQELVIKKDSVTKLRDSSLVLFEKDVLLTSFRGTSELTVADNSMKYKVSYDTIFNTKTAEEKLNILENAITVSITTSNNWTMRMIEMGSHTNKINEYRFLWHKKFSLSLTCIIFFFIGAPLGSIINKGGLGWPMIISIIFFLIYLVTDSIAKRMVLSSGWNPVMGAWLTFAIFLPIAGFFTYKSNTDSELFNPDTYGRYFNQLFGRMHKLIDPVNLDDFKTLSIEEQAKINYAEEAQKLDNKLDTYFNKVALNRSYLRANNLNAFNNIDELSYLQSDYEKLLSHFGGVYNESIRVELKEMPALNLNEYKYNTNILPKAVQNSFVGRLIISAITLRKRKKLKHVILRIKEKNNIISQIIARHVPN